MSFTYLITRPDHDKTTHYLFYWGGETIKLAEENDAKVLDLSQEKANRVEFESKIKKFSPDLIMLNGHGGEDVVTGHKNEVIVKAGLNEQLLNGKIVYALSCRSAKVLGPKSVQAGALNYTGFEDDFIFMYDSGSFSRPLKDPTAALFLEPSNIFIDSIIKGNSVGDSFEKTKEIMKKNFNKALSTLDQDPSTARYLWWNLRNFKSHGDMGASI